MEMPIEHIVYGVSLGPGDPELITLKGLKALQQADKIYYPGSLFKNGQKKSFSRTILDAYSLAPEKLIGFYLEMNLNRIQVQEVYEQTFQRIQQDVESGLKIAIVSEGDLSVYSSFSYLLEKFHAASITVQLVPGITSFCLGASESQLPIALMNESIHIVPRIQSTEELQAALATNNTVILMKIRSVVDQILPVLEQKEVSFTYCERLGTPQQFISTTLTDIQHRDIPYFSLLIIKKEQAA